MLIIIVEVDQDLCWELVVGECVPLAPVMGLRRALRAFRPAHQWGFWFQSCGIQGPVSCVEAAGAGRGSGGLCAPPEIGRKAVSPKIGLSVPQAMGMEGGY